MANIHPYSCIDVSIEFEYLSFFFHKNSANLLLKLALILKDIKKIAIHGLCYMASSLSSCSPFLPWSIGHEKGKSVLICVQHLCSSYTLGTSYFQQVLEKEAPI